MDIILFSVIPSLRAFLKAMFNFQSLASRYAFLHVLFWAMLTIILSNLRQFFKAPLCQYNNNLQLFIFLVLIAAIVCNYKQMLWTC